MALEGLPCVCVLTCVRMRVREGGGGGNLPQSQPVFVALSVREFRLWCMRVLAALVCVIMAYWRPPL